MAADPRLLEAIDFFECLSHTSPADAEAILNDRAARIEREAALTAERDEALAAVADQAVRETLVKRLAMERGGLAVDMEGGACQMLAETFASQFKGSGAVNYLEVTLKSRDIMPDEVFVVTLQRLAGATPHQKRTEAEAKLREAIAAAERDAALLRECKDRFDIREYECHEKSCRSLRQPVETNVVPVPCTCGLAALLARLRERNGDA